MLEGLRLQLTDYNFLYAYYLVLFFVAIQRFLELFYSRQNAKNMLGSGGVELAKEQVPYMVFIHFMWLLCSFLEPFVREQPNFNFSMAFFGIFILGQIIRYVAISTLGERWTVKVIVMPNKPRVTNGIYKILRHPNYLGVSIEIFAFPLIYGCYYTSFIFGLANMVFLTKRITIEEQAFKSYNCS